jgi:hypothetical protein
MFLLPSYLNRPLLLSVLVVSLLTGCVSLQQYNSIHVTPNGVAQSKWDFDHKLQYKKTKLSANIYQLEVVSSYKTKFERLSAFLLRRGYLICGQYGYKLEVIKGVESFDHLKASPNLIMSNLTAELECPSK